MKRLINLLCLLAIMMTAQVGFSQTVLIGGNQYAFQWTGDPDIGLYFSSSNSRYEFRDLIGAAEMWCNPVTRDTYIRGDLSVGALPQTVGSSTVRGVGDLGPTNGYLGVQGANNNDGVAGFAIAGQEVGVLGVSTGGSATDNSGVFGYSNGRGVYGEHSVSGNSAALATSSYSIDADGVARVTGGTDVSPAGGGFLVVGTETSINVTMDNNEIMARNNGAVSSLFLNNNGGDITSGNSATQHTLNGSVDMIGSGFNGAAAPGPWFMGTAAGTGLGFDGNEVQSYSGGNAAGTFYAQFYGGSTNLSFATGSVSMGTGSTTGNVTMNSTQFSLNGTSGNIGVGLSGASARTEFEVLHALGGPSNGISLSNEFGDQNGWNLYTLSSGALYFYQNDGATGTNTAEIVFSTDGAINTLSDARYKETVEPISNTLEDVMKLEPKSYYYKHDRNRTTRSYGFMAQDIQEIFPEIVTDNIIDENTGETQLMVTYSEFIPVIVAAMQEQNEVISTKDDQIDAMQVQLDAQADQLSELAALVARLDKDLSACCTSSTSDATSSSSERGSLSQNIPNPFNGSTTINYYLPKDATFASLKVVDINGSLVKEFNLQGEGFGQVSFASDVLAGGNYFYSLVIDGEVIDTKQMNLAK